MDHHENPETAKQHTSHTIPSEPPRRKPNQRRSPWRAILADSRRQQCEWLRVAEPMTKSTASQIASDLRCAHRREPSKLRITGVLTGDRWDAQWANDDADPDPTNYYVWLRWMPETPVSDGATAW